MIFLNNCWKSPFVLKDILSDSSVTSYNVRNKAINAGWNGTDVLTAEITITTTGILGSTSTATPAFDTDLNFPAGSIIVLNIQPGGYLVGKGGAGGNGSTAGGAGGIGLKARCPLIVNNLGVIGGGGGGGGGGSYIYDAFNTYRSGEGGGSGAGFTASAVGLGSALNGSQGSLTTGGSGAGWYHWPNNGSHDGGTTGGGGTGGTLGVNGLAGGTGWAGDQGGGGATMYGYGAGGAGGNAVEGNSYITWINTGTRYVNIVA